MKYSSNHADSSTIIKEMPVEDRPREKMMTRGATSLSDRELVMILLGSGSRKRPVCTLANDLLEILDRTDNPSMETLLTIKGMGQAKAAVICAAWELGRRKPPKRRIFIQSPPDVYPLIRHYADRTREHFICVALNGAHEVISVDVVSIGLVNRTLVHPREVFALPMKNRAVAVIVAHNHPSGNLTPSPEDLDVTHRLKIAGDVVGINVLDHLIFSEESFYSLLEGGEF
ncbi:RadC family protein [Parasphaerochaeta coccoides]|uniref:DNA repair protein RadC n=1 Tax=Parasphaerochaeta coccoides (strain ATCC BAA-1237 / DSM 17374 / SPN1) TaxID=760011 RepID=F4GI24_PARC1|nr:DNA repair protein RadC [Parasphaerochaeta coccoides]AEC02622.1 DNA repair protein RadC [Parasphaerochaeta coccoides DSM 17374]